MATIAELKANGFSKITRFLWRATPYNKPHISFTYDSSKDEIWQIIHEKGEMKKTMTTFQSACQELKG